MKLSFFITLQTVQIGYALNTKSCPCFTQEGLDLLVSSIGNPKQMSDKSCISDNSTNSIHLYKKEETGFRDGYELLVTHCSDGDAVLSVTEEQASFCFNQIQDACNSLQEAEVKEECPTGCSIWFNGCTQCLCEANETICREKQCLSKESTQCLISQASKETIKETTCPDKCKTWFDGCNQCKCSEDGISGCTQKFCPVYGKPKCSRFKTESFQAGKKGICPGKCMTWFDGCNECKCDEDGISGCTQKFCRVHGEPKCSIFFKKEKYDCMSNVISWSRHHKMWCCKNENKGCRYKCDNTDITKPPANWSINKKIWCCRRLNKGCP